MSQFSKDPFGQRQPASFDVYGRPVFATERDHPKAVMVLVLGVLGLVLCGFVAPFAWWQGNRVIAEIDATRGILGGRSTANAGRICGIIGTVLLVIGFIGGIVLVGLAMSSTTGTTTYP